MAIPTKLHSSHNKYNRNPSDKTHGTTGITKSTGTRSSGDIRPVPQPALPNNGNTSKKENYLLELSVLDNFNRHVFTSNPNVTNDTHHLPSSNIGQLQEDDRSEIDEKIDHNSLPLTCKSLQEVLIQSWEKEIKASLEIADTIYRTVIIEVAKKEAEVRRLDIDLELTVPSLVRYALHSSFNEEFKRSVRSLSRTKAIKSDCLAALATIERNVDELRDYMKLPVDKSTDDKCLKIVKCLLSIKTSFLMNFAVPTDHKFSPEVEAILASKTYENHPGQKFLRNAEKNICTIQ
jgi:hypothetical protein